MSVWLLLDRVGTRVARYYHRKVFLARLGSRVDADGCTILGRVFVNATNLTVGKNATIYPGVYFWGDGEIVIGDNCDIGKDTIIFASKHGGVRIGDNVNIAAQCFIIDSNHGIRRGELIRSQPLESERITIGDDAWISAQCAVIKGAEICEGAVIGAGAVVNCPIPAYNVADGVPARVIGERR